jgi:hypothetical protein
VAPATDTVCAELKETFPLPLRGDTVTLPVKLPFGVMVTE